MLLDVEFVLVQQENIELFKNSLLNTKHIFRYKKESIHF